MKKLLSAFLICIAFQITFGQVLPQKSEIIKKMKLVDDYWIATHVDPGHRGWDRAVYFTGNMDFYKTYNHHRFLEYSTLWAQNHNWSIDAGVNSTNADQQCAGQVYIEHFLLDEVKDSSKIAVIRGSLQNMINRKNNTAWWWIDALYMAMPSFARLGVILNDTSYFEQMYRLYTNTKMERGLYNQTEYLWYRDESFDPPFATPSGEDSYWARGNGWVFGAHVRVLQVLPKNEPHRAEYIQTFKDMASALLVRQREDGFWNVSLDDPNDFGGPETSGTAFFTYGLAWGINNGFLAYEDYYPAVAKAWNALTAEAVHEDGFLGYVQGVGVGPSSSQPVTSESTTDFGVGAFLLAGTEVVKLAGGEIPAPPTFWVNGVTLLDDNQLKISFNQSILESSATNPEHYTLSGDVVISEIKLGAEPNTVYLQFEQLNRGKYDISIQQVKSVSGEIIEDESLFSFVYHDLEIIDYSGYEANSTNYPDNTLDLDYATRWSASGDGQYITYDLEKLRQVEDVKIAFYSGASRRGFFSVFTSTDGVVFNETLTRTSSSGMTTELEVFDFPDVLARYVRLVGHGNSASVWNSWTEVEIGYSAVVQDGNGKLESLEVLPGVLEPAFSPDQFQYVLTLPFGTSSVTVNALPQNSGALVTGAGILDLEENTSAINVTVTSTDQTHQETYQIDLNFVKSAISTLSGIFLNGKALAGFQSDVTEYTVFFDQAGVSVPELTATLSDQKATIKSLKNATAIPGNAEIVVVAENEEERTYTIQYRVNPAKDSYLSDILIDGVSLEGFAYAKFEYDFEMPIDYEGMPEFTVLKSNESATVTVYPLAEIPGTILFLVTAVDGVSQNVYKINVRKAVLLANDITQTVIFPNPFMDQLNIHSKSPVKSVSFFTLTGQAVDFDQTEVANGSRFTFPGVLESGVYLMVVSFQSGLKQTFSVIRI